MKEQTYYNHNGLSPLQAYRQGLLNKTEYAGFLKGNIIKYLIRAGHKPDNPAIKDYQKAETYLKELIKLEEVETTNEHKP